MSENTLQQQNVDTSQKTVKDELGSEAVEENGKADLTPDLTLALERELDKAGLDHEQKEIVLKAFLAQENYSGPIPHPKIMQGYEDILPGAADRILSMAEEEAVHRHTVDDRCIKTDARDSLLGIIFAFILGMTCVIGGIVVIVKIPAFMGTVAGLIITGGGLAGILGTFLKGTKATWKMDKKE